MLMATTYTTTTPKKTKKRIQQTQANCELKSESCKRTIYPRANQKQRNWRCINIIVGSRIGSERIWDWIGFLASYL